jgi:hypothetical protein
MAARFGATIVPFAAVGVDDSLNILADSRQLAEMPIVGDMLRSRAGNLPQVCLLLLPPPLLGKLLPAAAARCCPAALLLVLRVHVPCTGTSPAGRWQSSPASPLTP